MPSPPTVLPAPESNGSPYPGQAAPLTERVVAASASIGGFGIMSVTQTAQLLARQIDEQQTEYGTDVYTYAALDPPIAGSLGALKYAALGRIGKVVPRVTIEPGDEVDPEKEALVELCRQTADLFEYTLERLEAPLHETLMDMSDAFQDGCCLAEKLWAFPKTGKYRRNLVLQAIEPKGNDAWQYVVDPYLNVVGIQAAIPGGQQVVFPPEKFAILRWAPKRKDPRGSSLLRSAVKWWNIRAQAIVEYFKFLQRFGSPAPWMELPPNVDMQQKDSTGITPEEKGLEALAQWVNGFAAVVANGGSINLAQPSGDGNVFTTGLDYCARMEVWSILLQVRATMEAEHGSKADSETSSDVLASMIEYVKSWYSNFVEWELAYYCTLYNFGEDAADRATPRYQLGAVERADLIQFLNAIGGLHRGGWITPSQQPVLDGMMGLPIRKPEEIEVQAQRWLSPPVPPGQTPPGENEEQGQEDESAFGQEQDDGEEGQEG